MGVNRSIVNGLKIKQGPRAKSLATHIVEYIVFALLDPRSLVRLRSNQDSHLIIEVNNKEFNFSEILSSAPDFEQILFTTAQLDAYVEFCKSIKKYKPFSNNLSISDAECLAIHAWTRSYYGNMNALLRNFKFPLDEYNVPLRDEKIKYILLSICIATKGLTRLSNSKPVTTCYRSETTSIQERLRQVKFLMNQETLVTNRGFTAASSLRFIESFGKINICIHQSDSPNPIGKSILCISKNSDEAEVLFPPNTEFKYTKVDDNNWRAEPVRSAISLDTKKYIHDFSQDELTEIFLDKEKIKINILLAYLKRKVKQNMHGKFRMFFDTVDNSKKLNCANNIIREIEMALNKENFLQNSNINFILDAIAKAKTEHQKLVNNAFFKASLGETYLILVAAEETMMNIKDELNNLRNIVNIPNISYIHDVEEEPLQVKANNSVRVR